ncbi:canalicular multispecific organic anion transporter 2-like [Selaginella moellendorffii]|uniref:canalicular multispecific organic anion transporter 2-like n=1 Tax=Selaginella moellendorffii TaxID=88036 RepID=UPI000D1CBD15|nr:canalicular multispecific organic anion transporter 2-like [Selaginella moellendorffii]|eukprot:XP_024538494.1 canalicular multispecific organic anion transporter 2-like [Selaginella moellendorffii]
MDPFGKNDDREIHEALTRAHFSSTQSYKNFDNGLDGQITSSGTNFSVGERQLLCLARSLLRKSKILIMDEATAAVDNDTDQIIQATIRASFQDCTVLTVAHRIQTIIDNDRVLVMEAGRIAEFDTPKNLLKLTAFFLLINYHECDFKDIKVLHVELPSNSTPRFVSNLELQFNCSNLKLNLIESTNTCWT